MPTFTEEDYDKKVVPSILKRDEVELVELAVAIGWTLHVSTNGATCTLIAPPPNEHKKLHLGKRNSIPLKRYSADVLKFGDPLKKAAIVGAGKGQVDEEAIWSMIPSVPEATVVHVDPEPKPKHQPESSVTEPTPMVINGVTKDEPETIGGVEIPTAHIISIKPMLAKASQGKAYESETTVERRWSDGTMDYGCTRCDYYSTNRLGVRSHWANVHPREGKTQVRPPTFAAEVPDAATYAPRKSRVEALAEYLLAQAAGLSVNTRDDAVALAEQALGWVHEQTTQGTELAAENEPMDDAEVLVRIRTLLDRGESMQYRTQIEQLERQVVEATARIEAAERVAARQAERADKAHANLDALRELIAELAPDKGGDGGDRSE